MSKPPLPQQRLEIPVNQNQNDSEAIEMTAYEGEGSTTTIKRGENPIALKRISREVTRPGRSGSVTVSRRNSDGEVKVKEIELVDSVEPIPDTFWYRPDAEKKRPTIFTLRFGHRTLRFGRRRNTDGTNDDGDVDIEGQSTGSVRKPRRFGVWDGVFARSLLNILGVILFIRAPWVVGQSGIGLGILIVVISTAITTITTLSMSAISTNGVVRTGGAYYMISRSLGPSFGAVIGILFSSANAVAIALYALGFCETLILALGSFELTPGGTWDLRIWAIITVTLLLGLAFVGISWMVRTQLFLLFILLLSILNYFIGTWIRTGTPDASIYFAGYTAANFADNWGPQFTGDNMSFFTVLAVFFPAVTGIMAGANISGDLKDAQKAIPKGTLTAVGSSFIIYISIVIVAGATTMRAGLLSNYYVMGDHSWLRPVFIGGVFAATLSSAIASLVGAPRVLQAVAADGIFPVIKFFAKGSGPENEPRRGYLFAYIIAVGCIMIGSLNFVALLITNLFLLSYGIINWACFSQSMSQAPGWRPSFRFYSPWVAVVGAMACFVMMFLIDWVASLISIGAGVAIYQYVVFKNPDVNWGSALQANMYNDTLRAALRLRLVKDHVKLYRPQILAFTGTPSERSQMIKFAVQINDGKGMVAAGRVIIGDSVASFSREISEARGDSWLIQNNLKAFLALGVGETLRQGARSLMVSCGIGKLKPNTAMLGYMEEWKNRSDEDVSEYMGIISDAMELGLGVVCLRGAQFIDAAHNNCKYIDVWWLSDDGGLTILLPHMLSQNALWNNSTVRVFTKSSVELTADAVMMTRLLNKFRIPAEVVPVEGVDDDPSEESIKAYLDGMNLSRLDDSSTSSSTLRHIRMGELLKQHSDEASVIFITMPVQSRENPARIVLSWMDVVSHGSNLSEIPVVFIRGNQEDVLTFYS